MKSPWPTPASKTKDYAGHAQHFRMIRIFDAFEDADQLIPNAIRQTSAMKQLKYLVENAFNPAQTAMFEASCQLCAENEGGDWPSDVSYPVRRRGKTAVRVSLSP